MFTAFITSFFGRLKSSVDITLFVSILFLSLGGLMTMNSFGEESYFFDKQAIWILISVVVLLVASVTDWRFLRKSSAVTSVFF